ncbi:MAG: TetR family transcriptional regulator [Ruminococcus sp.]|nr:TetR family transcriptional regulator [Ruminococcus sp.]
MYQGKNKTALMSQKMIAEAMLEMLRDRLIADISISELCKKADVSRQTFYSAFGSKENVIIYELKNNCCFTPEDGENVCKSAAFRQFCRDYSGYIIRKRNILEILVRNDMMHYLYDVQYHSLMKCNYFIKDLDEESRVYLVDFITGGMNSIAKNYVLSGCNADEKFLENIMFRLFGGLYFTGH